MKLCYPIQQLFILAKYFGAAVLGCICNASHNKAFTKMLKTTASFSEPRKHKSLIISIATGQSLIHIDYPTCHTGNIWCMFDRRTGFPIVIFFIPKCDLHTIVALHSHNRQSLTKIERTDRHGEGTQAWIGRSYIFGNLRHREGACAHV